MHTYIAHAYTLHIQWPISRWLIKYMSKDLLADGLYFILFSTVLHHVEHTDKVCEEDDCYDNWWGVL
jgi:hypothetical protein